VAKARIINIVATECEPDKDVKFNQWYNDVHIPMLMKYKGIKKVTRYKILDAEPKKPRYLAVYEYDSKEELNVMPASAEFKAAIEEMEGTWKGKGFEVIWAVSAEPLKTFER
jgi:antibiotic biosynthesis monooxygenase (ABM) superfamily enzyme